MPIFNRHAFGQLTLHNEALQRQLVTAFLNEADDMRCDIAGAATEGAVAFGEAVHRVRSASHFVAGDRLTQLLKALARCKGLDANARRAAARHVLTELSLLEVALNGAHTETAN